MLLLHGGLMLLLGCHGRHEFRSLNLHQLRLALTGTATAPALAHFVLQLEADDRLSVVMMVMNVFQ